MVMEGIILLVIGLVAYFIYYDHIYKRTKSYKEKQIIRLGQEEKQLLTENASVFEEIQSFLDKIFTREEQAKFTEELNRKDEKEISEMMKKLMQPIKSNLTDKAAAQRVFIMLHQFERTKLKYVRLMERLRYRSVDDRLKATQDWIDYVRIFIDQGNADRMHLVLVTLEEIEKRFDEKLTASGK